MQNHVYTFNEKVRRQQEGAMGNKLTEAVVKVFTSRWIRQLKSNPTNTTWDIDGGDLYIIKCYFRRQQPGSGSMPPRYRLVGDRLTLVPGEVESDGEILADERTAKSSPTSFAASSEWPRVDYPSRQQSGWVPILDLQVWIAGVKTIGYKFYQKLMAPLVAIANKAAMPS